MVSSLKIVSDSETRKIISQRKAMRKSSATSSIDSLTTVSSNFTHRDSFTTCSSCRLLDVRKMKSSKTHSGSCYVCSSRQIHGSPHPDDFSAILQDGYGCSEYTGVKNMCKIAKSVFDRVLHGIDWTAERFIELQSLAPGPKRKTIQSDNEVNERKSIDSDSVLTHIQTRTSFSKLNNRVSRNHRNRKIKGSESPKLSANNSDHIPEMFAQRDDDACCCSNGDCRFLLTRFGPFDPEDVYGKYECTCFGCELLREMIEQGQNVFDLKTDLTLSKSTLENLSTVLGEIQSNHRERFLICIKCLSAYHEPSHPGEPKSYNGHGARFPSESFEKVRDVSESKWSRLWRRLILVLKIRFGRLICSTPSYDRMLLKTRDASLCNNSLCGTKLNMTSTSDSVNATIDIFNETKENFRINGFDISNQFPENSSLISCKRRYVPIPTWRLSNRQSRNIDAHVSTEELDDIDDMACALRHLDYEEIEKQRRLDVLRRSSNYRLSANQSTHSQSVS